jgi:hypothetical protein
MYLGNYNTLHTVHLKFNTVSLSGVPTTLAGSPVVSVYKNADNSQTTTGVTLTVDVDSMTGTHHVQIATTDAFYGVESDYQIVLTAGTVAGNSVAGTVLGHFSIENRAPTLPFYPDNFMFMDIGLDGKVAVDIDGITSDVLNHLLVNPGNKLLTDASGHITVGSNTDKTGYSLSQAFPANFSSLAITGGGAVTVGTNSDKTGYSLTQAFPTNFASLSIDGSGLVTATNGAPSAATIAAEILATPANKLATDASGRVTIGSNADKTGYSLSQAFPANFSSLAITGGGAVTVGTNSDKTGYSLSQAFPTNFSLLSINGSGLVTSTNSAPSAATIAAEILVTPANKLATDGSGRVTVGSNADKTGYSLSQSFPANFSTLVIDADGAASANITKVSDDSTAAVNLEATYDGNGYDFVNCGFPGISTMPFSLTGGGTTYVTIATFISWPDSYLFVGSKVILTTASGSTLVGRVTAFNPANGQFTTFCAAGVNGAWPVTPQSGDVVTFAIDVPVELAPVTHTGAVIPTVSDVTTKTGYSLSQAFPANFSSLAINGSGQVQASNADSAATIAAAILASPSNKLVTDGSGRVTVGTNADKTGYSLTQAFPANFSSLAITGSGAVTVGTNSDKTGYSLTQAFPTNFSLLSIDGSGLVTSTNSAPSAATIAAEILATPANKLATDGSGRVTVGSNADKTGYALTQAFPSNFASMAISVGGAVTVGTNSDKTGYSLSQAFPSNFSLLSINGSGQVVSSNMLTAANVAAELFVTPANKLATDASGRVTVGSNADKTGYSLSQAFPANFASLAITVGGAVTVGTNSDKTGYSLSQAFPTNFAAMAISGSGHVTVGTNNDKTGYALTQAFPSNFSSLAITAAGKTTVGTNDDKTGYSLSQAFPANFALLSIDGSGQVAASNVVAASAVAAAVLSNPANKLVTDGSGRVTVGSNADKTGYSLSQAFPANFALLSINGSGQVATTGGGGGGGGSSAEEIAAAILVNPANKIATDAEGRVTTLPVEIDQVFPPNFDKLEINSQGRITVGINLDKTGYSLIQQLPTNFDLLKINDLGRVTAERIVVAVVPPEEGPATESGEPVADVIVQQAVPTIQPITPVSIPALNLTGALGIQEQGGLSGFSTGS